MVEADVDVVILSWHRVSCTVEAVRSVLRQEGVDLQVWIVDQGSGPGTLAVLRRLVERFPAVHLVELDRNVGVPAGRNIGIGLGVAPVVVGLDNDAVLDGDHVLRDTVVLFEKAQALGAVAFRILNARTLDDDPLSWVHPLSLSPEDAFPAARFCGAAHALRRSAFDECGGYDGALFFYWEEADLCRRMLEHGHAISYVPSLRALHRPSPEMRLGWSDGRYFFCVRNRLYVEYCHGATPGALASVALGYLVKGVRNRVAREGFRGVAAAVRLGLQQRHSRPRISLSPHTLAYLREHEGNHGSSMGERLRAVLSRLPGEP